MHPQNTTPELRITANLAADRALSPAAKLLDAALRALPGATPRELARAIGLDPADLEDPLAELRRRGL